MRRTIFNDSDSLVLSKYCRSDSYIKTTKENCFLDGRKWYIQNYVFPYIHSIFWVALFVLSLYSWHISYSILNDGYKTDKVPIPIYVDKSIEEVGDFTVVRPLENNHGLYSNDMVIARSLVEYYVKLREGGFLTGVKAVDDDWINKVKAVSSEYVGQQFINFLDQNIDVNIGRVVQIDKVMVASNNESNVSIMKVFFSVKLAQNGHFDTKRNFVVDVEFVMSNIDDVMKEKVDFAFVISRYSPKEM